MVGSVVGVVLVVVGSVTALVPYDMQVINQCMCTSFYA